MSKYSILYIDEQKEYREEFLDKVSDDSFEVKAIHPFASEVQMLDYIANEKCDAVIVDYGLKRNDPNITYNGGDIINSLNESKEDFPAFILTQDLDQDNGVDEHVKSTMILMKSDLNNNLDTLKRRVSKYIKHYQKDNEDLSKEYYDLNEKKQNNALSDTELERLNYLDDKLERRFEGDRKLPALIKDSESLRLLNSVLKDAEDFIEKNIKHQ